jgi:hypothetical protein
MTTRCNNICERMRAGLRYYEKGIKRCNECRIYIKTEANWCVCCGSRLRNGPRSLVYKDKVRRIIT